MARTSGTQREVIGRVMEEFKRGELSIGRNGPAVEKPKQAIAVALREAGASNRQTPKENRAALRRYKDRPADAKPAKGKSAKGGPTKERPAKGGPTRAALYAEARRRDVAGRSAMSKAELEAALR